MNRWWRSIWTIVTPNTSDAQQKPPHSSLPHRPPLCTSAQPSVPPPHFVPPPMTTTMSNNNNPSRIGGGPSGGPRPSGQRSCPGMQLGLYALELAVAHLCRYLQLHHLRRVGRWRHSRALPEPEQPRELCEEQPWSRTCYTQWWWLQDPGVTMAAVGCCWGVVGAVVEFWGKRESAVVVVVVVVLMMGERRLKKGIWEW